MALAWNVPINIELAEHYRLTCNKILFGDLYNELIIAYNIGVVSSKPSGRCYSVVIFYTVISYCKLQLGNQRNLRVSVDKRTSFLPRCWTTFGRRRTEYWNAENFPKSSSTYRLLDGRFPCVHATIVRNYAGPPRAPLRLIVFFKVPRNHFN